MTEAVEIILLCSRLCVLERMKVLTFLVSKNIKCLEHADGTRVNIDTMRSADRGELLEFVKNLEPEPSFSVD
jgi:hypothetical protein